MKKHKNAAHLRCRASLKVGFTVDFETGDIYDPAGEKLPIYFHASKDNRPQVRCKLGVSEFYMKVHHIDGIDTHRCCFMCNGSWIDLPLPRKEVIS